MADKITNDITLLFKTKLDEKSKQEIGKNLKGLLENAAIGFDEAETKRNVEPIIQMIKRLFDKAEIAFDADKLLAMPSRKALEEMAKIEVNQLQLAFDKALAKSGGVKIDFGDIGLSELAAPLKQIESELSDISRKIADTTKKSVYEIEQSLESLNKRKKKDKIRIAASPEGVEEVLAGLHGSKAITPAKAVNSLEKARDLYTTSVKEDNPWVLQYKYLLDFVSKYERLTKDAKNKIEAERPELTQLYDMLSPKAGAVKISLEHYVDVAKGNELSEYKNQPWGRESTLKEIRDTLKGGISVKEGSGGDNNHKDNDTPPWEDKNEDVKPKTPNTKIPTIDNTDVNAAEQAKKAEEERLRIAEQRRIEQEKIAEMLKKEAEIEEEQKKRSALDNNIIATIEGAKNRAKGETGLEWGSIGESSRTRYLTESLSSHFPLFSKLDDDARSEFFYDINGLSNEEFDIKDIRDNIARLTMSLEEIYSIADEETRELVQRYAQVEDSGSDESFDLADQIADESPLIENLIREDFNDEWTKLKDKLTGKIPDGVQVLSSDVTQDKQAEVIQHQQNTEAIKQEVAAEKELNQVESQNPPAQDDTSVHNANVEAINKEIEAYKQRDIERMSQGDITSLYWAAKHPEIHDGELEAALQSNPNLISELTAQRDDLQGKLQPIQEMANKISQMSSIKDIPFDQLRQEAINVGQRLSTMYDQGITDTEEYIALQYKLIKIIDQIGVSYGGVKGSGAKDTSELRRWVRNSIESEFGKDPVDEKVVEALWGQGKFSIMKTNAQTFNQRDMAGRLLGTDEIFIKSDSDDLSKINLIIEALSKISPIANTAKTSIDGLNDSLQEKEVIENSDNNGAEIAAEKAETDAINQQNEALKENIDLKTKANAQDSSNHILSSLTKLEEITNKSLSEVINDYDNLDNSIKQNVDSILQSIGLMGSDGQFLFDRKQGGNAKAFVTDNFVILQKHITTNNEEIGIFIEKLQQAKQEGIQLAEVLGQTFSLNAKEDIGFRKGYEIQERGEGSEVHASPKLIDLNQALAENQKILNLSDEHLQKFILDYIKLDQIGLQIDPSKPSNFLLDAEKGITFIDIGLKDVNAKAKSTADIFTEIATILSNMVGYMKFGENGDWSKSSGQIVNRIRDIFTQLNLSSGEEMNKIIEERFIRNNDMKSVLLPENTNISADSSEVKASIDTEELRGLLNSITYNVKVIQDAEPVEGNKVSINADELRSVLDGITYNVKLAQGETDGDSNKIAIDEGILENVLNRITYDVKIAHDDADKTSNKIAIDESALEGVLNRVFGNILAPKDEGKKPEGKKEPWALEKTLNTTIKGVLDQIQTNTAKVDATSDTTGISEIKSILESINAKIVKGGVIATRGAVKQAGAQAVEPDVKRQAARSNMMKSLINDYKTMGKLAAQFASDGNLETKAMLENLKEEIRRKRSSLNITMDENANLREKYSIAFEAMKRLLEAEKQQEKINEKNKSDAKAEKKKLADAKKLAQREAMVGKAGNAVSRAENTWMTAAGMEDALPKDFDAKLDDYYHKLDALRKKQAELKNSDVISEEDKADLIYQTNNVNKLTDEISGLIAEYQKLSGSNATVIGTNTLGADAGIGAYEQQLKRAVMTATNGKAQIKGFDAATKTLTYTVKTGKNEFTQYTAAVRNLDGQLVAVQGTTKRTETFLEATKRKMKEITSYMSGMALLSRAGQELRRGIQYVRDIDLALTELRKVTDETEESYERFLDTAAKTADKVGSTIQKVVSSTADWARLNI